MYHKIRITVTFFKCLVWFYLFSILLRFHKSILRSDWAGNFCNHHALWEFIPFASAFKNKGWAKLSFLRKNVPFLLFFFFPSCLIRYLIQKLFFPIEFSGKSANAVFKDFSSLIPLTNWSGNLKEILSWYDMDIFSFTHSATLEEEHLGEELDFV